MASADPSDLAGIPLFAALSDPELAAIAGWFEAREVAAGVQLVGEGTTGASFFVVSAGELAVSAGGSDVGSLGAGDFFGEMALLDGGRRKATVRTRTDARVLVLFADDFRRLRDAHPAVADRLEATMRERMEELER